MSRDMSMSKRGKALDPARNDRLREIVRAFVQSKHAGNVTAAAARFGVSQPLLSNFLAGKTGAGNKLLEGMADAMGVSMDYLVGRERSASASPASPTSPAPRESRAVHISRVELDPEETARAHGDHGGDSVGADAETPTPPPGDAGGSHITIPKMRNLPNWGQLVKTAKQMEPSIPEWVYERLASSNPMLDGPVSASGFVGLLQWIWKHTPPPPDNHPSPRRR